MTYIAKPKFHHPSLPKNALGFTHRDYEGKISTLCAGCGSKLRPKSGDCCVFCSYGSVPCPPMQAEGATGCCANEP